MKSRITLLLVLATLPSSIGVGLSQQAAATKAPSYDFINLGTPLGGSFAIAAGISYGGFLGGYANTPDNASQHAILWYPNNTKDLGTLGGPNSALLEDFSGFSETSTADPLNQDICETGTHLICLPITVVNGKAVALPLLGGDSGAAFGNNQWGQVAGVAQTTLHDPSCLVSNEPVEPFLSNSAGSARRLDQWKGSPASASIRRHRRKRKCDQRFRSGHRLNRGLRGQHSSPCRVLAQRQAPYPAQLGRTDEQQCIGHQRSRTNRRHFGSERRPDRSCHPMAERGRAGPGHSLRGLFELCNAINNFGQIVGSSCDVSGNCRGFLWEKGKIFDLNTLIPSNPNLSLILGANIDDAGVIVGYAYDQTAGTYPAFVLSRVGSSRATMNPKPHPQPQLLSEAAPRVSIPESMRTLVPQNLRTGD